MPSVPVLTKRLAYLVRDLFITAKSAPLGPTRNCEPTGQITVTDTNSVVSINSLGKLVVSGSAATNNGLLTTSTLARKAGRCAILQTEARTTVGTSLILLGWSTGDLTSTSCDIGVSYQTNSQLRTRSGASGIDNFTIGSAGTDVHTLAFLQRAVGGFVLARVGTTGPFQLLWVYNAGSAATYFKTRLASGSYNWQADNLRILDLTGLYADDYGLAVSRSATPAANDTGTGVSDGWIEYTFTAATGVTVELSARRTDDNNRWIIRCDQGASTISIIERNSGSEVSRGSGSQTWTNGSTYRLMVYMNGSNIRTYINSVAGPATSTGSFNATATGIKVNRAGTDLVAWPLTIALPSGA